MATFAVVSCTAAWIALYFYLLRDLDRRLAGDIAGWQNPAAAALIEIRSLDGEVLYRSPALGERVIAGPVAREEGLRPSARSDRLHDGTRVHRLSRRGTFYSQAAVIRAARSEAPMRRRLRVAGWILAVLAAGATVGTWLVQRGDTLGQRSS